MQTASWRSHGTHAGRPGTPGVGSDCPAALPSLSWLRGGTAGSGSSPWPTAPTSRGGRFRRSDSTFSPVARCRALPSVHAPQSPVPCVHLRPPAERMMKSHALMLHMLFSPLSPPLSIGDVVAAEPPHPVAVLREHPPVNRVGEPPEAIE